MLVFAIIFGWIRAYEGTEVEVNNTTSPVLFTLVGQAALKTAYGHLIVPVNLPDLKKSFDELEDLEVAINKLTTTTNNMAKHKGTELHNLRRKLDIVHHLALTKAQESHFEGVDTDNLFHDELKQALGDQANKWKPGTPGTTTTTSTTTTPFLRIKRSMAVAGGVFQLAGFALSLFNRKELNNVKLAAEATETHTSMW